MSRKSYLCIMANSEKLKIGEFVDPLADWVFVIFLGKSEIRRY